MHAWKPRTAVTSTAPRPPKGGKVAAVTPCAGDAARRGGVRRAASGLVDLYTVRLGPLRARHPDRQQAVLEAGIDLASIDPRRKRGAVLEGAAAARAMTNHADALALLYCAADEQLALANLNLDVL